MAFTAKWFDKKDVSGHWTKSMKSIPEKFSLESIRQYLVDSCDKTFDKDSVRAFKSLKAYKYFQEGYVQKIFTCESNDVSVSSETLFMSKAEVMASMERKIYKVFICLSSSGEVMGGSCKCVAGMGSVCSHMAALLFALQDFISQGFLDVPDEQTCTDKLKQWNVPAKRQVEHTTIDNIKIYRPQLGKKPRLSKPRVDIRHPSDRSVDESAVKDLHQKMTAFVPNCGFSKYGLSNRTTLPSDEMEDEKQEFIYVHPPSLTEIKLASDNFVDNLTVSDAEIREIEFTTRNQSNSKKWHKERQFRITASNFHQVNSRRESTDPARLLGQILGYSSVSTKGMKFGLRMEKQSKIRYMDQLQDKSLTFEHCGLCVSKEFPFLGASPDGILVDDKGKKVKLVEFKNPSSTWSLNIQETAMKLPCLKLNENNVPVLNTKDKYYTQIQGQMGVCGIRECDFVLCTSQDIFVETIHFDEEFWNKLCSKLRKFYRNYVAPEIVYPTVKYGYCVLPLH